MLLVYIHPVIRMKNWGQQGRGNKRVLGQEESDYTKMFTNNFTAIPLSFVEEINVPAHRSLSLILSYYVLLFHFYLVSNCTSKTLMMIMIKTNESWHWLNVPSILVLYCALRLFLMMPFMHILLLEFCAGFLHVEICIQTFVSVFILPFCGQASKTEDRTFQIESKVSLQNV